MSLLLAISVMWSGCSLLPSGGLLAAAIAKMDGVGGRPGRLFYFAFFSSLNRVFRMGLDLYLGGSRDRGSRCRLILGYPRFSRHGTVPERRRASVLVVFLQARTEL